MSYFESIFLGIIQGLTEFLPISSSGHLVLFETFFQLNIDKNTLKGFDVILHLGTLLAIFYYFRTDLLALWHGVRQAYQTKTCNNEAQLVRNLILATLPALFVGFFFNNFLDVYFRNVPMVALMLFMTGLLLFLSEKIPAIKKKTQINLKSALVIGLAQSIALIPGISRSGTTISIAMLQGITREKAARFSFLLAIPAISAATGYILLKAFLGKIDFPALPILFVGFMASLVSSYLCISFLMNFIRKHSLAWFSLYLWIISSLLLIF